MKISVSKIGAAKSQLMEAINLFFEDRDPVSVHTLSAASLQILYDHFNDTGKVWDHNLMFHYDAIHIKDEYRGEWINLVNEFRNFFKHADKDLKNGKNHVEFETEVNHFYIMEAIRCLGIMEGEGYMWEPEFRAFFAWYIKKYPHHIKNNEGPLLAQKLEYGADELEMYHKAILFFKENPDFVKRRGAV